MSAFVNIEVDRLIKKQPFCNLYPCSCAFYLLEGLIVYRNTGGVGCVSEKACNYCVPEFWAVIFVRVFSAIPIRRVY